jgi:hypothetical protein
MKKPFIILLTALCSVSYGQSNQKLIELGKAYKNFMFMSEPPKDVLTKLSSTIQPELAATNDFIIQTITTKNNLLEAKFLKLPDANTLKQIYIIRAINYNIRNEDQIDNTKLIDSLQAKDIPRYELVDTYYDILFNGVGNKNQPFNFKKVNFNLDDYGLLNDTEKGIFFLEAMSLCGTSIWGYINVPKPPNYKLAYEFIGKFPKFNGLEYYEFTDLNFPDFEMVLDESKGKESYKGYYLNKYYETLLYHLICLKNGIGPEKDIQKVMIGSILKDESLYKYSKNKDILDDLFETRKR